jgi:GT2 family glycosyltransferase
LLDHARGCHGEPEVVSKLSLFCAMLRREAFDAAGGLDEGYGSGMFEDDDLCMALRTRDLDVVLVPSVFVHHAAGTTLRRLDPFEYHARFEVNRARFERRWRAQTSSR